MIMAFDRKTTKFSKIKDESSLKTLQSADFYHFYP